MTENKGFSFVKLPNVQTDFSSICTLRVQLQDNKRVFSFSFFFSKKQQIDTEWKTWGDDEVVRNAERERVGESGRWTTEWKARTCWISD